MIDSRTVITTTSVVIKEFVTTPVTGFVFSSVSSVEVSCVHPHGITQQFASQICRRQFWLHCNIDLNYPNSFLYQDCCPLRNPISIEYLKPHLLVPPSLHCLRHYPTVTDLILIQYLRPASTDPSSTHGT